MPPLHILLTPSSPPEVMRLAAAVAGTLAALEVTTTAGFLAGARARGEALLREDADGTLVSTGAADALMSAFGTGAFHRVEFPGAGYYAPGALTVVTRDEPGPIRRVAVDDESEDHRRLTKAAFAGRDVEFVSCPFTIVPRAVLLRDVDAGVWHRVDSLIPLDAAGLRVEPLAIPEDPGLIDRISGAVLLTRPTGPAAALFREVDAITLPEASPNNGPSAGMPLRLA